MPVQITGSAFPAPQPLIARACRTGEGPLWHPDEQRIYWTDIPACRLYRCAADGSEQEAFDTGEPTGGIALQADGALALFMARGAVRRWKHGRFEDTLLEEIPAERDSRFNDVVADPRGRVFAGTMSSPAHGGRLYRLDPDGTLALLAENMGTPNGMGFSPDLRFFYQNDSRAACLYRYRYDEASGSIAERETLFEARAEDGKGRPDGLTVDADGCLWTARWDGACLVRHAPDGEPLADMPFPVRKVSSLTFGGAGCDTLFATTAGGDRPDENGALAGALFVCRAMPVRGRPEYRSRL